jgi:hypothetical protein
MSTNSSTALRRAGETSGSDLGWLPGFDGGVIRSKRRSPETRGRTSPHRPPRAGSERRGQLRRSGRAARHVPQDLAGGSSRPDPGIAVRSRGLPWHEGSAARSRLAEVILGEELDAPGSPIPGHTTDLDDTETRALLRPVGAGFAENSSCPRRLRAKAPANETARPNGAGRRQQVSSAPPGSCWLSRGGRPGSRTFCARHSPPKGPGYRPWLYRHRDCRTRLVSS